ncbi:MAG: acyl-CoA thioester hydrolase [Saprospiraceae bacterium]|jgi:acyl-CoA thioester hydrolase
MFEHTFQKRVRYGETDQMGYLYYGNYAQLYEIGRAELIRSIGLTYKDMEKKQGILMPVVSMNSRFVRPALYDELLTIKTILRHLPEQDITFFHEIFNEQNKLVNGGSVRLCFVESAGGKRVRTPEYLRTALSKYFN